MAFPPAHILVGLGAAEVVRAALPLPKWPARIVAASLAVLPDADIVIGLVGEHAGSAYHGTFTHSIFATLVVALVARVVAGKRWGVLAGAGYGSHLLVDLLDERGKTNVLLGWPFTKEYADGLAKVFPIVPFEQGHGAVPAALSLFRPEVFSQLAIQTAIGAAMLGGLLAAAWLVRRARASG